MHSTQVGERIRFNEVMAYKRGDKQLQRGELSFYLLSLLVELVSESLLLRPTARTNLSRSLVTMATLIEGKEQACASNASWYLSCRMASVASCGRLMLRMASAASCGWLMLQAG
jgi:hypothetical protein